MACNLLLIQTAPVAADNMSVATIPSGSNVSLFILVLVIILLV